MALSTKTIKSRIRSIGNTKKITKAMEMVSAAKMRKATGAVLASRDYSNLMYDMISRLSQVVDPSLSPLIARREQVKRVAVILISSNRGLCGGFNAQVIGEAMKFVNSFPPPARGGGQEGVGAEPHPEPLPAGRQASLGKGRERVEIDWIALGKNGAEFLARNKKNVIAQFEKEDIVTSAASVTALSKMIITDYISGKYDVVYVVFTDYISAITQKPRVKQLLPIVPEKDMSLGALDHASVSQEAAAESDVLLREYVFEPTTEAILNHFLPRMIESQLYQALLESNASEHSARMMAMKNASEAASDMIDDLTLAFNQARQANITREIAEIAGGKAALE